MSKFSTTIIIAMDKNRLFENNLRIHLILKFILDFVNVMSYFKVIHKNSININLSRLKI